MKGKRIVHGLIAGTVLIGIVAAAPILSSLAWAQQIPKQYIGTLRVVVINRPSSCGGFMQADCPTSGSMTTSVVINDQIVKMFRAAGCGKAPPGCWGPDESFKIRGDDKFSIVAKGEPPSPSWKLVDVYFASTEPKGVLPGCIDVHHTCSGVWPHDNGTITIDVNYYWEHHGGM